MVYWFMVFNITFNNISVISYGCQFYWWRKPEYLEKTTDLSLLNDKLFTLCCIEYTSPLLYDGEMSRKFAVKQGVTQSFLNSWLCHTLSWHVVVLSGSKPVQVFQSFVFISIAVGGLIIKTGRVGIPLTDLI